MLTRLASSRWTLAAWTLGIGLMLGYGTGVGGSRVGLALAIVAGGVLVTGRRGLAGAVVAGASSAMSHNDAKSVELLHLTKIQINEQLYEARCESDAIVDAARQEATVIVAAARAEAARIRGAAEPPPSVF
jgi:hypothetical protein